ncbi:hypothetical protein QBC45DRAFT_455538 [Copromyces sp. CBS 386.78]|nr:hypothetical protein QBC45DRAFT_455538 [Copromyces sp. CBS 386.78]
MEQGPSTYLSYRENPGAARVDANADAFSDITDAILALVRSGSGKPWVQPFQYSSKLFLHRNLPITTLDLGCSVLRILFETEYANYFWHHCLPTVQDLTLRGFYTDEKVSAGSRHNWNTILPQFKDTLEHLSMSGYKESIDEDQMTCRFGPSRMLTCLPELEKLAYLKVPLHFVSSYRPEPLPGMGAPPHGSWNPSDVSNNDHQTTIPITAKNVGELIECEFPPSLKTVDIIDGSIEVVWNGDKIQERDTYRLRLQFYGRVDEVRSDFKHS